MAGRQPPPRDAASDRPADLRRALRQGMAVLAEVQRGRGLFIGSVELSTGTSTVLQDSRLSPDAVVLPDPLHPDAAAWAVQCPPANRLQGQWTLTHAAGAAGRVWRYVVFA